MQSRHVIEFGGGLNLGLLARSLSKDVPPELQYTPMFATERVTVALTINAQTFERRSKKLKVQASNLWKLRKIAVHFHDDIMLGDDATGKILGQRQVLVTMRGNARQALRDALDAFQTIVGDHEVHRRPRRLHKEPSTQTHRIRLTKTKNYKRALEKLGFAQQTAGYHVVKLDEDSEPPALVTTGNIEVLRNVQQAIFPEKHARMKTRASRATEAASLNGTAETTNECEICYNEVDAGGLVKVARCGHSCCEDCFKNLCCINDESVFPIGCFALSCRELVSVKLMQLLLDRSQFTELIESAVEDYHHRHPESYAMCSGPACGEYYRLDDEKDDHVCRSCFTVTCTKCKVEKHFGESCNEYKTRQEDGTRALYAMLRREGRGKCCQRCNMYLEKLNGCNNMQCPGCKAHFCFTCMAISPSHGAVYKHMLEAHGSYGDEEAEAIQRQFDGQ